MVNKNISKNNLAPICFFTFNRLNETKRTVEALKKNYLAKQSELYIFSDGPRTKNDVKKINSTREYLKTIDGFKSVIIFESTYNKGLANSIISGVTSIINKHKKVIVLEDDLVTSPNFLNFMNDALLFYKNESNIKSISGFSPYIPKINQIYFQKRPFPWGWATWGNRWDPKLFNKTRIKNEIKKKSILKQFKSDCGNDIKKMLIQSLNGKNDSWYVRWTYNHFIKNKYSVFPKKSLTKNIGFNIKASHCKSINTYKLILDNGDRKKFIFLPFKKPNKKTKNNFLKYFSKAYKLNVRLKILFTKKGIKKLINELIMRLKK